MAGQRERVISEIGAISSQIVELEERLESLRQQRTSRVMLYNLLQQANNDTGNSGPFSGDRSEDQPEEAQ
jgi:Tfp pilus assembly protein PilO